MMKFECASCGQIHEGSPSFGYDAPAPFLEQTEEVQEKGKLTSDTCTYKDEDGQHFFIRVALEVPIQGVEDPFVWGVWVSLSEDSFVHYVENYEIPEPGKIYFGWLCNYLPYYKNTYALAMDVHPRSGGIRPYLVPHNSEHELVIDYFEGLSYDKAAEIAELCMHGG